MTLGIIAALPQEIADLLKLMKGQMQTHTVGMRTFYQGKIGGQSCVLVLARVGKVAASATCVTLIQKFGVSRIIFTGLAGGVSAEVNVGDIVVGTSFCQHDMNAEPLFPRYEIPLLGKQYFASDSELNAALIVGTTQFLQGKGQYSLQRMLPKENIDLFGLTNMKTHQGLILSGDQFIGSAEAVLELRNHFPDALCTEMEGAAVAQVCYEYGTPFAVLRVISDKANNSAGYDFTRFLNEVAPVVSSGILLNFLLS